MLAVSPLWGSLSISNGVGATGSAVIRRWPAAIPSHFFMAFAATESFRRLFYKRCPFSRCGGVIRENSVKRDRLRFLRLWDPMQRSVIPFVSRVHRECVCDSRFLILQLGRIEYDPRHLYIRTSGTGAGLRITQQGLYLSYFGTSSILLAALAFAIQRACRRFFCFQCSLYLLIVSGLLGYCGVLSSISSDCWLSGRTEGDRKPCRDLVR